MRLDGCICLWPVHPAAGFFSARSGMMFVNRHRLSVAAAPLRAKRTDDEVIGSPLPDASQASSSGYTVPLVVAFLLPALAGSERGGGEGYSHTFMIYVHFTTMSLDLLVEYNAIKAVGPIRHLEPEEGAAGF